MYVVETRNLTRIYKSKHKIFGNVKEIVALDDVSFKIKEGELFGYVGPNGAGKTTTIKILTTLLLPTSGVVRVLGHDVRKEYQEIRKQINFIFGGERGFYLRLSGKDNLKYFGDLYKIKRSVLKERINSLLELVGLQEVADRRVETYSRGMKQRLHIARGLINDPKVLFMDEPTIGLDPSIAKELRNMIKSLPKQGTTVFLTTHNMFEADYLCDQIAIIDKGKIKMIGTPSDLKSTVKNKTTIKIELYGSNINTVKKRELNEKFPNHTIIKENEHKMLLSVLTSEVSQSLPTILSILDNVKISSIQIQEATLEDAYLQIVGCP
ncbi:ABC transporter ATP-binding protein [Thermococci archaeon]|nr:MAG: ABC transporter ATP-binding protein [Thermococci archaeon]